ncbi:MAG: hypothetical protein ACFFC7_12600 [Candidatus Hermodarchaeota archaeon]
MIRYDKTSRDSILGEEEEYSIENAPVSAESIGRPVWWFDGSLFVPKTAQERKLAKIQYHTVARNEITLSERAQRVKQCIGLLSEWFPLPLLDEVGKELLIDLDIRLNTDTLLVQFLGVLESVLRKRSYTIRWHILQEIEQVSGQQVKKKDIYKWMFYTRQQKKEVTPDTLQIVQRLTLEEILKQPLSPAEKRLMCQKIAKVIKILRNKGFICKDPEIASWSLKRIVLEEKSVQKNIPKNLRTPTTRVTCRIRKILE